MSTLANGIYRFQNASPVRGFGILTLSSVGQVAGAPLDTSSDNQKWKVVRRSDGHYDITNVGTGGGIQLVPPSGRETEYTLAASPSGRSWDLEVKGVIVMIKGTGQHAGQAVDLSSPDRIVLWDRNDYPNQYWAAERIRHRATPTAEDSPKKNTADNAPPVKDDKKATDNAWKAKDGTKGSGSNTMPPDQGQQAAPQWVSVQNGVVPHNAIAGSFRPDGSPFKYVARAYIPEAKGYVPGKARSTGPNVTRCWIPYGGREVPFVNSGFDILVGEPGTYKWVSYQGGRLDLSMLGAAARSVSNSGRPIDGCSIPSVGALYPIRAMLLGEQTPGKAGTGGSFSRPGTTVGGCAVVGRDNKEHDMFGSYDVLCYVP